MRRRPTITPERVVHVMSIQETSTTSSSITVSSVDKIVQRAMRRQQAIIRGRVAVVTLIRVASPM
jgi:hypothetical protein